MKDDIADGLGWPLKVTSGTVKTVSLSVSKNAAYIVYEVNYNGRTSYVSDLLAIAKFPVR